ncbi:transcriptional regulator [Variovorax ginsengisoli]|uniref:Helix-turn-helix domain-containing protein n=1 Tax=Variovorax ginsengisoli TaxID=363844 RepID=A0ABT9SE37_9BURK|nr:YdaS family helix-turn-helix protein [Variovorax ginsengisoli]MDP9902631.1 hypothetical protein [Variovorax ginsengisoli]
MKLIDYLRQPGTLSVSELRIAIGAKSDTQIRQWQHGYAKRIPSPQYCIAIERATGGSVTRRDLRPADWQDIWPEFEGNFNPPVIDGARGPWPVHEGA